MLGRLYIIFMIVYALASGLASAANSTLQKAGVVSFNNRNRHLFDVDGNLVDVSEAKLYRELNIVHTFCGFQLTV